MNRQRLPRRASIRRQWRRRWGCSELAFLCDLEQRRTRSFASLRMTTPILMTNLFLSLLHFALAKSDFWCGRCGWSVAAAVSAYGSVDDHHADSGQVSFLNAIKQILSGRVLSFIHQYKRGFAAGRDHSTIELPDLCGVSSGETDRYFCGNFAERRKYGDHS